MGHILNFTQFLEENWTEEENAYLSNLAVDKFGTTRNPHHITWITPLGDVLDGSGYKLGNKYPHPTMRDVDHRDINSIIYDEDDNVIVELEEEPDIWTCLDNGWVRVSYPYGFDVGQLPNEKQMGILRRLMTQARTSDRDLEMDITVFKEGKAVHKIESRYIDDLFDRLEEYFN